MSLKTIVIDRMPALGSRDFLIFWLGQFISLTGTWMQATTLPYLAYRLSGSPLDLGLIGFANTLPALFLALPGGVLVERVDKRKMVIGLQAMMMVVAFLLAWLTLNGQIVIWHILILAFLMGCANAIEITARQAMLVEMVGRPALPNAIALQATIFNGARVLGPALFAPFLIAVQDNGEGWAFLFNGVSYLVVIVGLAFVRTPYKTEPVHKNAHTSPLEEFREGMGYIIRTPSVSVLVLIAGVVGFFGFPFMQQIPAVARDILSAANATQSEVAANTSALYTIQGVGALVAALFLAFFSNFNRKGLLLIAAQFTFGAMLIAIAHTRILGLALPFMLILGWSSVMQLALMNTLLQTQVPDALRGRVFSAFLWALQGVAPMGSLFIGWLAQNWGIPTAAITGGAICIGAAILVQWRTPVIRQMRG
jgi:MFS family permease